MDGDKHPSVINGIWCNPTCPFMEKGELIAPARCKMLDRMLGWHDALLAACMDGDEDG